MGFFDDIVDEAKDFVSNPVGTVEGWFGGGDPSGGDHGSSNWPAWGHDEIRKMLDHTVDPRDINEAADAWRGQGRQTTEKITEFTKTLHGIVDKGWRGGSAQAAIATLGPINKWSASVTDAADYTAKLMHDSGYYAGQAKATVPPAPTHNWMETVASGGVLWPSGAIVDAVAQHEQQQTAKAEAVRIMTNVYSAPINQDQAEIPAYPQLADPTLQPPEASPVAGPSLGAGLGGTLGAGFAGSHLTGGGGGAPGGGVPYQPPATAGLQHVAGSSGFAGGGATGPGQFGGSGQPLGGSSGGGYSSGYGAGSAAGAAAAGVPLMTPMGAFGGDAESSRRGLRGAGAGGGRPGGLPGRAGGTPRGQQGFGPRGSAAAAAEAEGRMGAGLGNAATRSGAGGAGAGGAGGAPMAGAGSRDEDKEHRRPSYLIEMDDIFNDGRKVAPPVIGEDPPDYY